jgi:hypothetical protein
MACDAAGFFMKSSRRHRDWRAPLRHCASTTEVTMSELAIPRVPKNRI